MSLIKFDVLVEAVSRPFIEDEHRLQDWSLWLRLLNAGYTGVFVNQVIFTAHFSANSVSVRNAGNYEKWRELIADRYNKT